MLRIFDGHNDSVQRLQEYRPDGIDFLARSAGGHLDLPRAIDGGLVGGLFAMFVRPEHPPLNDLIVTKGRRQTQDGGTTNRSETPRGPCRRKDSHSD
jgi:hypothetical protein